MSTILEKDTISVNMLITKDLYPMPYDTVINKNMGDDHVLLTNEVGEILEVITGQHMIIELEAVSFVNWVKGKKFWLFNAEQNKFQSMKIKVVE